MSKSMIAAGVASTAISFQAAAQCPDCEDLTCNWFACGCIRSVGTGCSTTINTGVPVQGIPGAPTIVASGSINCCNSQTACGPKVLTYSTSSGHAFCITVTGGWDPGSLPGWTFSVGGQWCYNSTTTTTSSYSFTAAPCTKRSVTILERSIPITITTVVTRTATYSVTDNCSTPTTYTLSQACGSQTHTAQSTTKSYEVVESGSACPAGSPCRRRPGSIDTTGGDSDINLENSIIPSSN